MMMIFIIAFIVSGVIGIGFSKQLDALEDKVKDRIGWLIAQVIIKYRKER